MFAVTVRGFEQSIKYKYRYPKAIHSKLTTLIDDYPDVDEQARFQCIKDFIIKDFLDLKDEQNPDTNARVRNAVQGCTLAVMVKQKMRLSLQDLRHGAAASSNKRKTVAFEAYLLQGWGTHRPVKLKYWENTLDAKMSCCMSQGLIFANAC